jgi:hypothetical protein
MEEERLMERGSFGTGGRVADGAASSQQPAAAAASSFLVRPGYGGEPKVAKPGLLWTGRGPSFPTSEMSAMNETSERRSLVR